MSWNTAQSHPTLKRSWARITTFISALAIAILLINFFLEGPGTTIRLLPGFLFCVVWQQSDLFWHLGLNRQTETGELLPTVGVANTFTWLRGLAASFLLGRLIGGISTPSWLALLVFLAGIVTDILDGQVARYTRTRSKVGQIADGETDFFLYSAITIILIQDGVLPLWLGLIMLLRFLVPAFAALASYFIFTHPIRFGSTVWGQVHSTGTMSLFPGLACSPTTRHHRTIHQPSFAHCHPHPAGSCAYRSDRRKCAGRDKKGTHKVLDCATAYDAARRS